MPGKLYLVGAGPGDPGLLTLKGRRCLERADIVISDYLANPRLLDYARSDAERILVGKHGGGPHVDQAVITALLIEHARHGKIVVRLKGGDPTIFGRLAEEATAAAAAGIDFEIVPGVSSAIAVPAYAGIPLTHRDTASNVIFCTGYEYPGKPAAAVHWDALARAGSTVVILMAQRQLADNLARLIAGGLPPSTPAAVIQWGTRADQRTIAGTVETLAAQAAAADLRPPAIAVVGEVVRLREQLNWFERKPLFGRRIVITRPRAQASEFAERLEEWGAEVVPFPTIETVPPPSFAALDDAIARASEFDIVIFTSANGVAVFFDRLAHQGADVRDWHRAHFAAIGPQTARALERFCIRVDAVPDEYRAEGVVRVLAAMGVAGKRILLPRAAAARAILPVELRKLGAVVEEVSTYSTVFPRTNVDELRALLEQRRVDLITFTSSSTVENFASAFGTALERLVGDTAVGCIGPITGDTARAHGLAVRVQPESYTIPAFVDAIVRHYMTDVIRPRNNA